MSFMSVSLAKVLFVVISPVSELMPGELSSLFCSKTICVPAMPLLFHYIHLHFLAIITSVNSFFDLHVFISAILFH